MKITKYVIILVLASSLVACGSDPTKEIRQEIGLNLSAAESSLSSLNNQLDAGTLRNASLLPAYARVAREKKPEFGQIIDVLASEGTQRGPTYQSIVQRLDQVKPKAQGKIDTVEAGSAINLELLNIRTAVSNYDAMLVDALNMLADFTDGTLPKVREIEFEDSKAEGGAIGSEYVGNSNYGQWKTGSNGSSFWQWYGQYAFFSMMFGNRPVYYDSWSSQRRPSYYHDRNRGAYSSPRGRANQSDALAKTKKSYTARGKSFKSPYAKNTKIKGQPNSTKSSRISSNKPFKSSYAKTSSRSNSSSSSKTYKSGYNSRSSGSRRSSFGGK